MRRIPLARNTGQKLHLVEVFPPKPPKACEHQVIYQLTEVVLNCAGIDEYTDGNQRVESKVKNLVTEERDDPNCMLLKRK